MLVALSFLCLPLYTCLLATIIICHVRQDLRKAGLRLEIVPGEGDKKFPLGYLVPWLTSFMLIVFEAIHVADSRWTHPEKISKG